ncbi:MAG TPA: flagellar biosynthesis protein FliQ [Steroidobacteraceae bacterium]|nr:flagellar biosynthesis protein FliQ [Steroidobacteraceae bacterium]
MTPETVMALAQHALTVTTMLAAPMLIAALIAGLAVGMIQAATQINEMTLSFIPKLLVLVATLFIAGPWMLKLLVSYTRQLFESIPSLIG